MLARPSTSNPPAESLVISVRPLSPPPRTNQQPVARAAGPVEEISICARAAAVGRSSGQAVKADCVRGC